MSMENKGSLIQLLGKGSLDDIAKKFRLSITTATTTAKQEDDLEDMIESPEYDFLDFNVYHDER